MCLRVVLRLGLLVLVCSHVSTGLLAGGSTSSSSGSSSWASNSPSGSSFTQRSSVNQYPIQAVSIRSSDSISGIGSNQTSGPSFLTNSQTNGPFGQVTLADRPSVAAKGPLSISKQKSSAPFINSNTRTVGQSGHFSSSNEKIGGPYKSSSANRRANGDAGPFSSLYQQAGGPIKTYSSSSMRAGGDSGPFFKIDQHTGGPYRSHSSASRRRGRDNVPFSNIDQQAGGPYRSHSSVIRRKGGNNGPFSNIDQQADGPYRSQSSANRRRGGDSGPFSNTDQQTGGPYSSHSSANRRTSTVAGQFSTADQQTNNQYRSYSSSNRRTGGYTGHASTTDQNTSSPYRSYSSSGRRAGGYTAPLSTADQQTSGLYRSYSSSDRRAGGYTAPLSTADQQTSGPYRSYSSSNWRTNPTALSNQQSNIATGPYSQSSSRFSLNLPCCTRFKRMANKSKKKKKCKPCPGNVSAPSNINNQQQDSATGTTYVNTTPTTPIIGNQQAANAGSNSWKSRSRPSTPPYTNAKNGNRAPSRTSQPTSSLGIGRAGGSSGQTIRPSTNVPLHASSSSDDNAGEWVTITTKAPVPLATRIANQGQNDRWREYYTVHKINTKATIAFFSNHVAPNLSDESLLKRYKQKSNANRDAEFSAKDRKTVANSFVSLETFNLLMNPANSLALGDEEYTDEKGNIALQRIFRSTVPVDYAIVLFQSADSDESAILKKTGYAVTSGFVNNNPNGRRHHLYGFVTQEESRIIENDYADDANRPIEEKQAAYMKAAKRNHGHEESNLRQKLIKYEKSAG